MRWLKVVKCQPQQDCICRREQTHLTLVWDIVIAEGGELESPLLHASLGLGCGRGEVVHHLRIDIHSAKVRQIWLLHEHLFQVSFHMNKRDQKQTNHNTHVSVTELSKLSPSEGCELAGLPSRMLMTIPGIASDSIG